MMTPQLSRGTTGYAPRIELSRPTRWVFLAVTGIFAGMLVLEWAEVIPYWNQIPWGADYTTYMEATKRWLAGGPMYHPYQLAGPYVVSIENAPILYPPPMFVILAVFSVLPGPVWVLVPVGITAWAVWHHRPGLVAWPVIVLALWFPTTQHMIVTGNPGLWVVAAMALGTVWGWPAVAVLLKPSLAPFALWGAHKRSWWVTLALAAVVSLPLLVWWVDYAHVLLNARGPVTYSIDQVPVMLIPIAAWLASPAASARVARGSRR